MIFREPQPFEYECTDTGVVLLHAYTGSPNDMNFMGRALQRAGYGVYAPLFTGHGTIEPMDILTKGNPDIWWAEASAAVSHMTAKYDRVFVFGLSLGGIFAMKALEILPGVTAGGVFSSPILPGKHHLVPGFLRYAQYMNRLAGVPDESTQILAYLPGQLAAIDNFATGVAADLYLVNKPIFIGQAGADELVDGQLAYQLRDALINAPQVDFHWYDNAKHVITVNSAHHALQQDVIAFMQQENEG
ncbi:alpha/beta hydrolase [Lacticaseibacillus paracasei]|uniref:alpha/beta hydrolase n=1 Tax=Lacticaseibacillus paracasei TaxID=1597 RepID=UPI0025A2A2E4|nr:alpha/beta fold hydrolase [Lacticaseibacillus paracasei]MDM7531078.1 alpha/beta hydrolase [Lacticaseibacillus paracasei]